MNEIWKPVIGYEGIYEVSSFGRVRSLDRVVTRGNGRKYNHVGKVLGERLNSSGYPIVSIRDLNKKPKTFTVHRLVMESFVCKRPNGMEINHKDGNIKNNHLQNLEYLTPQQNIEHAFKNGFMNIESRSKKVMVLGSNGENLGEYYSAREAGRVLKMDNS